jgi:hypothetical protein
MLYLVLKGPRAVDLAICFCCLKSVQNERQYAKIRL